MTAIGRTAIRWITAEAYRKLSAIFASMIVYQWIRSFGDYWWSETFTIVNGVLLAAAAANLLLPSKLVSGAVQLIILLVLNVAYSGYAWMPFEGNRKSASEWLHWISDQITQLSPFLWISLGVWLVFHLIVLLRHRRIYIMLLIGSAVFSLTVADSMLTPLYLWDEIAWLVFIGLGWLVVSHFAAFKKRHPENWAQLLEYPVSLFLPILLIITLVMGAGLFVPSIKPVLTDPYTAWKEARGEPITSLLGDKAITIASTKSDADTRSGYGRNDSVLGGGFTFDYTPVMTVTTNKKSYWRGETKALYSGSGWVEAPDEKKEEALTGIANGSVLPAGGQPSEANVEVVKQAIEMVRKDKFPVLFGAGPITKVDTINNSLTSFPALSWLQLSWELRLAKSVPRYPSTYTVESNVPVLDEKRLRAGDAVQPAEGIDPMYMQLPEELPDRVKTLAIDLTRNEATPYDKVKALVTYLQVNYSYTNTPDLNQKESNDFVDAFLFEIKEGYCDYFSTSLAVMARSIGIPARWVKGYSSGSLPVDPDALRIQGMPEIDRNPDGAGTYTVRNSDAHSWVEIYFNGYGWLPFEATAGFAYPYSLPKDAPVTVPDTGAADDAPLTQVDPGSEGFHLQPWMFWAAAGILVLFLAGMNYRRLTAVFWRYRGGSDSVNARIVNETNRLMRYCRKKGLDFEDHETVRETMGRWSTRLTALQPQFRIVQHAFEQAMYGSKAISQQEADHAAAMMKQIREHLGR
nr:transglutaminase-like domain-containing protein [Paenibacillus sp. R14(2021)]